jgi:N utilization substance protein A
VKEVIISDDFTQADVIVPDHQLSLAIGKEGQNARLAARLTGVRIDIRGETEQVGGYDDADYEEGQWVQNPESGEMEWHAADGSIVTQQQYEQGGALAAPTGDDGGAVAAPTGDDGGAVAAPASDEGGTDDGAEA